MLALQRDGSLDAPERGAVVIARTGRPAVPFDDRVDRSGGPDACWPWTGPTKKGYGVVWYGGRVRRAHCVALERVLGRPLAPGMVARHLVCDNPPCCNPAHLAEGTQSDNVADMVAKGRQVAPRGIWSGSVRHPESRERGDRHWSRRMPDRLARGERAGTSKLTAAQVTDIRRRFTGRHGEKSALAREFGVSNVTVGLIVRGKTWVAP